MKLIIGGGISGLSAAYYLTKKLPASEILLAEGSNRVGGWIKSTKSNKGDYIFELAPRTLIPRGVAGLNTVELIEELQLESKVIPITSTHPAAKNRMIYAQNELHYLPTSLYKTFIKSKPFSKPFAYYALRYLFAPVKKIPENDESIYSFIERRFGKDLADYAISPLICGICAGDAKEISVKFLLRPLFELEQNNNSIIGGIATNILNKKATQNIQSNLMKRAKNEKWNVYFLEGGLETLPKTIYQYLNDKGVKTILNSPCTKLEFHDNNVFAKFKDLSVVADHVICSLVSKKTGELVEKQHPQLASLLFSIPTVTVGVVNLQYNGLQLKHNAFGFLTPPTENTPILGVTFDSCCFNCGNNTILTAMIGGKWFQKYFGENVSESELLDIAVKSIRDILKIEDKPQSTQVNILKDCIPQYTLGHYDRVNKINSYIKENKLPLSLCGMSYSGVGINDVILSAKNAVNF